MDKPKPSLEMPGQAEIPKIKIEVESAKPKEKENIEPKIVPSKEVNIESAEQEPEAVKPIETDAFVNNEIKKPEQPEPKVETLEETLIRIENTVSKTSEQVEIENK
jgi:hypothetical protein